MSSTRGNSASSEHPSSLAQLLCTRFQHRDMRSRWIDEVLVRVVASNGQTVLSLLESGQKTPTTDQATRDFLGSAAAYMNSNLTSHSQFQNDRHSCFVSLSSLPQRCDVTQTRTGHSQFLQETANHILCYLSFHPLSEHLDISPEVLWLCEVILLAHYLDYH